MYSDNSIEITYTVFGFDEAGETSFDMEVSDHLYNKLQDAEDEGEMLDSDYISEEMPGIHRKILKAIRENMEEEGMNPDDGMIEKRYPWGHIIRNTIQMLRTWRCTTWQKMMTLSTQ